MNNRIKITIGTIVALFILGAGVLTLQNGQDSNTQSQEVALTGDTSLDTIADPTIDEQGTAGADNTAPSTPPSTPSGTTPSNTPKTVSKQGTYLTLAEYDANPGNYSDSKKVYFFHATWCSVCQGIDKEIKADISRIPSGVTLIKTDFDSATNLRKKYGVTLQYTFVQVDNNGNEVAQWSATNLNKVIAGIKS